MRRLLVFPWLACAVACGSADAPGNGPALDNGTAGVATVVTPGSTGGVNTAAGGATAVGTASGGLALTASAGATALMVPDMVNGIDDVNPVDPGMSRSEPATCIDVQVQAMRLKPTVLLLLDRSASMMQDYGNETRWDALVDTLVNPTTGALARFAGEALFGIATYTSMDGNAGGQCPTLDLLPFGMVDVTAATAFFPTSAQLLNGSDTPTPESLAVATALLAAEPADGRKAILLVTDGSPDTCADPDGNGPASEALSVAAASAALEQGISTYVIGVGDQITAAHLQDVANAGIGEQNAPYVQALDASALADGFNLMLYSLMQCDFVLNGQVAPADASKGTVLVGGVAAKLDDPNGWSMPTPSTLSLSGSACDAARAGALLNMAFPCGVFTPL